MAKSAKVKFVTDKVRFSFVNVFEPAETLSGLMKYSTMIMIPKSDKAQIAKFNKAFEECKQANAGFFGGTVPKLLKGGLRDGDTERDDENFAGYYFVNALSNEKPGIVDVDVNPILDKSEFYSGCWGRASVTFFAYDVTGAKGITLGLNNVMKLEDGERLGGTSSAAADFAV